MNSRRRTKLLFGPYKTPRFKYDSVVFDQRRGEVRIVGLTDARIPWPIGQRGRAKAPILYGGLARAVRRESSAAIAYWWKVGHDLIWKWLKALGVEPHNPGTVRLMSSYRHELAWHNTQQPASNERRRRSVTIARIGKPRPQHVIEAMLKGRRGKPLSKVQRQKVSLAVRAAVRRPWARWEDRLLLLPMRDIMARTGRSLTSIRRRRKEVLAARPLR